MAQRIGIEMPSEMNLSEELVYRFQCTINTVTELMGWMIMITSLKCMNFQIDENSEMLQLSENHPPPPLPPFCKCFWHCEGTAPFYNTIFNLT